MSEIKKDITKTEEPFYYTKFNRSENLLENIKSMLGIFMLHLPFFGIGIFLIVMYYQNIYIKIITMIMVISQYFFIGRVSFYFEFIKKLNPQNYYKSFTLISEEEISKENTMLPFTPHGIFANATSTAVTSGWNPLERFGCLATRVALYIPLSGFFGRLIGYEGVDRENFLENMKNKRNILFIPGGFECATLTNDEFDQVFIRERKGFIKYALMHGYKIHPVYIS